MYPQEVISRAEKVTKILKENNFFGDEELDETIAIEVSNNEFSKLFFPKWIKGERDFDYSDGEFEDVLKNIIMGTVFLSLKNKGLIDEIDDNYFLTKSGKQFLI
jgi:hypothetical protein